MYQLIDTFIESAKEMDDDIFPFMANKDWEEGKPVYYSGPYWDDNEARELIYSVMKGKWLSSGEKVNRFEHEFSRKSGQMATKLSCVLVVLLQLLHPSCRQV
jgi:hypothetical protein